MQFRQGGGYRNDLNKPGQKRTRQSNFELLRIFSMLIIMSHHYVVNSGLLDCVTGSSMLDLSILILGWGGKTGINCFILITGYFMCTRKYDRPEDVRRFLLKFVRLVCEIEFYKIIFWMIFTISGYQEFSFKLLIKAILPFYYIADNFNGCFLMFYLLIPFLNRLVQGLTEKEHRILLGILLFVYTIMASAKLTVNFNYVTWFSVLFILASYIRIHLESAAGGGKQIVWFGRELPIKWFDNCVLWGILSAVSLAVSWTSIAFIQIIGQSYGKEEHRYFFVSDCNKILAVVTAVCLFLFFKNLKIPHNEAINTIAASAFGVLLIHANSDAMRQWLWGDVFDNAGNYSHTFPRVFLVLLGVYVACTLIDMLRIRVIEQPLFYKVGF